MIRIRPVGALLLGLAILGFGCRRAKDPIVRITDTEGRQLLARCNDESCEVRQKEGAQWPGGKTGLLLERTGVLVAVCNVDPGATEVDDIRRCRALECADDRECPPEPGDPNGHCINGLCVDPVGELGPDDSVVLCLAGTGLGTGSDEQIEAHAMGLNCGTPCVVPKTCRQP